MTFTVVARHPVSGRLGIATASAWFAIGREVPLVSEGVGAVAAQADLDPTVGSSVLGHLRRSSDPAAALAAARAADPGWERRQVLAVTPAAMAAHTGGACPTDAGHRLGADHAVVANVADGPIWDTPLPALPDDDADLASWLVGALDRLLAAGGDRRGCRSAALLVGAGAAPDVDGAYRRVDLRVDDADDPIGALERLLRVHRRFAVRAEEWNRRRGT